MQLHGEAKDIWVRVEGSGHECLDLVMRLDEAYGCQVWVTRKCELWVMLGALLDLKLAPGLASVQILDTAEIEEVNSACTALEESGILRDYQARMVESGLLATCARGIISAPPGAGKTRIAAGLCVVGALVDLQRWHYVAPNEELADQATREIMQLVPSMVETIYDGSGAGSPPPEVFPKITSSSYAKLSKVTTDGLIIDECHGVAAANRSRKYSACKTLYRIGLSGTPLDRSDDKNGRVIGLLGPIVDSISRQELVERGYLAQSRVEKYTIGSNGELNSR